VGFRTDNGQNEMGLVIRIYQGEGKGWPMGEENDRGWL
jgi:hypothetical protein